MNTKPLIGQALRALYGETVILKRADDGWLVTGELHEDAPKEIMVIGTQYTVHVGTDEIESVRVHAGFHPMIYLAPEGRAE